jgi:hypothetical protein
MDYLCKEKPEVYNDVMQWRVNDPQRARLALQQASEGMDEDMCAHYRKDPSDLLRDTSCAIDEEGVKFYGKFLSNDECKATAREIYKRMKTINYLIGNDYTIKGKVVTEVKLTRTLIPIATLTENKQYEEKVWYLGERWSEKKWTKKHQVSVYFWEYLFQGEDKQYYLFSEDRLNLETCTIEGMVIPMGDIQTIGEETKLHSKNEIFMVYKVHRFKPVFTSKEEMIEAVKVKGIGQEAWFKHLYSHEGAVYNQPEYIQWRDSAWLLAAPYKGYPLHVFEVARQGTGKSTKLKALHSKFDEPMILEGSLSTIKGLIPSFATKGVPDPGFMLLCERFCGIDEFLRMMNRVQHKDERSMYLGMMNSILEHQHHLGAVSAHGQVRINPRCKVYAVSNPVWGTSSMEMMCEHVDNAFLSRWLVWYQDDDHIKFIEAEKGLEECGVRLDRDFFLGLYDFMQTFRSVYERERVMQLFRDGLLVFGDDSENNMLMMVKDVYTSRYRHHIECLIDGLVKTRCLVCGDASFVAVDSDYEVLKGLWFRMLIQWGYGTFAMKKDSESVL